jgi:hypothetical protein
MLNIFFFENYAVYEIMWKSIVEPDRPQIIRDIFDVNVDLDNIISMSAMMRTEEIKKNKNDCREINNSARTANVSCQISKRKPIK